MVDGIHAERLCADDGREARCGIDVNAVHSTRAFIVELVRGDAIALRWQILHERSAESDVHDLNAATDGKRWQPALAGRREQRELRDIAGAIHWTQLGPWLLAVLRGVHIFAAGENEAGHGIEQTDGGCGIRKRRDHQGDEARGLERVNVRDVETDSFHTIDQACCRGHGDERCVVSVGARESRVAHLLSVRMKPERHEGGRKVAAAAFQSIS
jgi:hypothetical protein